MRVIKDGTEADMRIKQSALVKPVVNHHGMGKYTIDPDSGGESARRSECHMYIGQAWCRKIVR